MGAYSSKPETDTMTEEGSNGVVSYGASAMQGWRLTQEDAHVTLLDFETDPVKCHLFAVFDGHGGGEVAQFAAQSLPTWVKKLPAFKQGDVENALIEAFLSFDKHLTQKEVIQELKVLAGDDAEEDETEELNEAIALQEEADMPIEQLMAKYNQKPPVKTQSSSEPKAEKSTKEPVAGSSGVSASSSRVRSESEVEDKPSDEPASGESSQPAASTSNGTTDSQTTKASNGDASHESKSNGTKAEPTAVPVTDTPSVNQSEAGKEETSIEGKEKNDESEAPKKGGKGKQKKVVIPKPKRKVNPVAAYQQFLEDVDDEEDSSEEEDEPFGPANALAEDSDDDEAPADDSEDSEDDEEESDSSEEEDEALNGIMMPTRDFEEPGKDSGCTAVVAVIRGDTLFVANAGDSRCVVSCSGKAIEMSEDHKPEDERELDRIQKAGGKVTIDGRVNGGLNLSRALGDHTYKDNVDLPLNEQMISPEPDVRQLKLTPEHEFMILACDGIWNSMTSQEVVDFVGSRLDQMKPAKICEELFHHCLAPDTSGDGTGCDNMTAIIVTFDEHKQTHKRKMEVDGEPVTKKAKEEEPQQQQPQASGSSS